MLTVICSKLKKIEWKIGQIQPKVKNKVTVNFENAGKKVINGDKTILKKKNIERN